MPTRRSNLILAAGLTIFVGISSPAFAQVSLIPVGAKWKFLADGTDQGKAWRERDFDDSTWPEGPAKLGFGDEDVTTQVAGGSPESRIVTTYFRHAFMAVDAAALDDFLVRLLRDDGAIVYLNGAEVFRSNMPEGEVTAASLALEAVAGDDENVFVSKFFRGARLVEGRNLLAVEVHQSDPTSSDLGFNVEFLARFQLKPPTVSIASPGGAEPVIEGPVTVTVEASFVGGDVTAVSLFDGDQLVGEDLSAPFEFSWVAEVGDHTLTARAATSEGLENTSAPVVVAVAPALVRQGSSWRYLADGTNQGRAWRDPGFDDSSWFEGRAELGYGDGDEATVVASGPDSQTNYITTYFRKSINIDDPDAVRTIEGLLIYDDGAVVYLNGVEVFRINMPPGDPAFNAPAVEGTDYEPERFSVEARHLRRGVNVIAVEVHQSSQTSSDISFDLMLRAAASRLPERRPSR